MKSTMIWVLRHLVVPVGFIWATGIITWFNQTKISTSKDVYHTFNAAEYSTLEMTPRTIIAYSDSLFAVRQKQVEAAGLYDPDNYFHDLKQFRMFEVLHKDSLDSTTEGRILIMRCLESGMINRLAYLRDSKPRKAYTNAGCMSIENARRKWFPLEVAKENAAARSASKTPLAKEFAVWVSGWIIFFYVRGLPFAFLMLLIWRLRLKEDYEDTYWRYEKNCGKILWSTFTPLSFILSLLAWPIVLAVDLINRWNSMLRKVDVLSRREKMMSLFSLKEQQLFLAGKKMSRKEFKSYLSSNGMVRKHSFAKAFVVYLFFTIAIPRAHAHRVLDFPVVKKECVMYSKSFFDTDVGFRKRFSLAYYIASDAIEVRKNQLRRSVWVNNIVYFPETIGRVLSGFSKDILSVPRVECILFSN